MAVFFNGLPGGAENDPYTFAGANVPTADWQDTFGALLTSDSNGQLEIQGTAPDSLQYRRVPQCPVFDSQPAAGHPELGRGIGWQPAHHGAGTVLRPAVGLPGKPGFEDLSGRYGCSGRDGDADRADCDVGIPH